MFGGESFRMASDKSSHKECVKTKSLNLTIELVPATVWYSSLYKILKERGKLDEWREIKRKLYAKEGRKCYICGSKKGPFEAHEFWEYDDENHVQRLVAVHHLCSLCHKIKHIGFWCYTEDGRKKLKEMGLSKKDLIEHFCKVNNCTPEEFEMHEQEAFGIWRERSKYQWKQDFGKYQKYLE